MRRAPSAFLLPVLAFLGMPGGAAGELRGLVSQQAERDLDPLPHFARWLVLSALVGLLCFLLPVNRHGPAGAGRRCWSPRWP